MSGSNWAYEISCWRNGTHWQGEAISTFDANTLKTNKEAARKLPLVMRLHRGDMVILLKPQGADRGETGKKNGPIIMYVVKMNGNKVTLAEQSDSVPDKRQNAEKSDRLIDLSGESLRTRKARKIDVSPAGLMRIRPIPESE